MTNSGVLGVLLICAIMGMVGQGVRAAVGLKSAATLASQNPSLQTQFDAAYFLLSLMIGAIAGVLGGFSIGLIGKADLLDTKTLLSIAAFGYGGTDFIENVFTNLIPGAAKPGSNQTTTGNAPNGAGVAGTAAGSTTTETAGGASAIRADDVRKAASASAALATSMQSKYAELGDAPLSILHQAADGRGDVKSLLATAVDAYTTLERYPTRGIHERGEDSHMLSAFVICGR